MSQTGTRIIQILAIVAFLVLALSMLMNWKIHREIRTFHKEKFSQLQNELQIGMTKEQVRSKLNNPTFKVGEISESHWTVQWFDGESKDAQRLQTERLGVPTSAELRFDSSGKLEKIDGRE